MNPELTQQLTKDYPEMFQYYNRRGAEYFVIECGDGWYNIIDNFCKVISKKVNDNNQLYEKLIESQDMINNGFRDEVPRYLQHKLEALENGNGEWPMPEDFPVFRQIKEKFGTLNLYMDADEDIWDIIGFAELMSAVTCEDCGDAGKIRSGSWIRTLCDKHHEERQK